MNKVARRLTRVCSDGEPITRTRRVWQRIPLDAVA